MKQVRFIKTILNVAVLSSAGLMVACNSSDSAVATTSVSGYIVAAPVDGAEVNVVDVSGNVVAGPVNTDAAGKYTLTIPNSSLAQDLILKSSGGTFNDEATGSSGTAGEMFAYVLADSLSSGSSVSATPGSTIVAQLVMNHNKTMTQAQEAFTNAFGYTPDITITPADATGPAADATEASRLAGLRAAAFSQLAMDLGLLVTTPVAEQFYMFAALADDLSDGVLDGVGSSGSVAVGNTRKELQLDIQSQFANALVNFHDDGNEMYMGNDLSGLGSDQIGTVPFANVAITSDGKYKIKYIPGMMSAMEGKSSFKLLITDLNDNPVNNLTPTLVPMMHMATMTHSSPKPVTSVLYDNAGDGMYTATVYYLMASQMMDGMSMGYWDIKVDVDSDVVDTKDDVVHFYPPVMMAMGDTAQVRLKGVADQVMAMGGGMEGRTYFIFKDSLMMAGMNTYNFTVFLAAKQDMMNFPAVYTGSTLSGAALGSVLVEISDDDGVSWSDAIDNGDGTFTLNSLTLTDGVEDQIRVRLTVTDTTRTEMKTTDGATAVVDTNDYQTFTVTPGGM